MIEMTNRDLQKQTIVHNVLQQVKFTEKLLVHLKKYVFTLMSSNEVTSASEILKRMKILIEMF